MTASTAATARTAPSAPASLATASVLDTAKVVLVVVAPAFVQGAIRRRPRMVRLARRLDTDWRAGRLLQRLRRQYGVRPLMLKVPGRSVAVVLSPDDVQRILRETPDPFTPATTEKRAALRHFQPHGVLISTGEERTHRRTYNERVLDTPEPLHRQADAIVAAIRDEVRRSDPPGDALDWRRFSAMFARVARRVTLGEAARDDERLTRELDRLRDAANWAYLRPRQEGLRQRFQRRVDAYVARAEPGSLAGMMAGTPSTTDVDPAGQVPHWLFAFDAAAMTAFRTLALLGSDPSRAGTAATDLRFLGACVQETLRLWPTTLAILRESTQETDWGGATLPAHTSLIILSSFFQRDEGMHYADRFTPEIWLSGAARRSPQIFPFSGGSAECAGRNLVLLVMTTVLAELLRTHRYTAVHPLRTPLPGTVDQTRIQLRRYPIAA
ncbi:cytochrome P450 [Dactylosporangium sp. NPDC000521]|uniref:cytochrome P450 n=1 Tax=Dactylosporangium sp. NPDC000521 TaxID=3363975 RepID=UPI0036A4F4CF